MQGIRLLMRVIHSTFSLMQPMYCTNFTGFVCEILHGLLCFEIKSIRLLLYEMFFFVGQSTIEFNMNFYKQICHTSFKSVYKHYGILRQFCYVPTEA